MLFKKEYDNSLWLILSSGKFDSEYCEDFIKGIPGYLFSLMYQSFVWYQTYKKNPDKGFTGLDEILNRKIKNEDGLIYWYSINPQTGELEIGETLDTGEDYFNTSVIRLMPMSNEDINSLDKYEGKVLGEYNYVYHVTHGEEYEAVVLDEAVEFTLEKTIFNKYIVETCDILPFHKIRKRLADIDNIPEAISKDDLKVERASIKKLLRTKK